MADLDNNYVVGRGKVYFDRFKDGSKIKTGEMYFGNSPEFSISQSNETLDHYSSDEGLREKDASVDLQNDTSFSLTCDNISTENLALWFLGEKFVSSVAAATGIEQEAVASLGRYYQLGETPATPFGHGNVDNVEVTIAPLATGTVTIAVGNAANNDTVTVGGHVITFKTASPVGPQVLIGASVTDTAVALKNYINAHPTETNAKATNAAGVVTVNALVRGPDGNDVTLAKVGTNITVSGAALAGGDGSFTTLAMEDNWEVNLGTGRVQILHDAIAVSDGDPLVMTYDTDGIVEEMVLARGKSIFGALRFIAFNPVGLNKDYYMPYVKLSPDGDYALKGDDWQVMSFSGEMLKLNTGTSRLYIRAREAGG